MNKAPTSYDLIGDIHGYAEPLEALLQKLGYTKDSSFYRHPDRQAIFLGDFIDRGPHQRDVIGIVRPMIDSGTALAVIGNHEFNAICYATLDDSGKHIRPHTKGNRHQHEAFLAAYPYGSDDHKKILDWFKTLPLFLELDDINVVHACWDKDSMDVLTPFLNTDNTLSDSGYQAYSVKNSAVYKALEILVKGPEQDLPQGAYFHDHQGILRTKARFHWWGDYSVPLSQRLCLGNKNLTDGQKTALDAILTRQFNHSSRPTFFGHYWLEGEPSPMSPTLACVDYSIAKPGGKLVAYRWNGEKTLNQRNYVW